MTGEKKDIKLVLGTSATIRDNFRVVTNHKLDRKMDRYTEDAAAAPLCIDALHWISERYKIYGFIDYSLETKKYQGKIHGPGMTNSIKVSESEDYDIAETLLLNLTMDLIRKEED